MPGGETQRGKRWMGKGLNNNLRDFPQEIKQSQGLLLILISEHILITSQQQFFLTFVFFKAALHGLLSPCVFFFFSCNFNAIYFPKLFLRNSVKKPSEFKCIHHYLWHYTVTTVINTQHVPPPLLSCRVVSCCRLCLWWSLVVCQFF